MDAGFLSKRDTFALTFAYQRPLELGKGDDDPGSFISSLPFSNVGSPLLRTTLHNTILYYFSGV
jgi:hypothetical protein